jgi:branched-chain amino acid transport system ATP-binding protein
MKTPLLDVQNVSKYFGGIKALENVSFKVNLGERVGLIGPNGSGKTTMVNVISGVYKPDRGKVFFNGIDITKMPAHKRVRLGITRTFQIPRPFGSLTVLENVTVPLLMQHSSGNNLHENVENILKLLSLDPNLNCNELTMEGLRKLELARALSLKPKLLILDETLAGLTEKEVSDMLNILKIISEQGITLIMIEHIMKAVMEFCERIIVFDSGTKIMEGTPTKVSRDARVVEIYLGK